MRRDTKEKREIYKCHSDGNMGLLAVTGEWLQLGEQWGSYSYSL